MGTWNLKAEMTSGWLALATRHGHTTMTLYASETLGALLVLYSESLLRARACSGKALEKLLENRPLADGSSSRSA